MKLSYEKKKSRFGFLCVTPWIVGFLALYLYPLAKSLQYTFSSLDFKSGSLDINFLGLTNYKAALFSDPTFTRQLITTLKDMLYQVPTILVYSMIIAIMLNHKFRGRTLMRAIFFIPVIIATGVVMDIIKNDLVSMVMLSDQGNSNMFKVDIFKNMLSEMGMGGQIVDFIINTVNNIFDLSWRSGIQMILFLSGLQSIPVQLYEAASIDGCTSWERFWKITFPIISPIIAINLIYSIIDHFTSLDNQVMNSIVKSAKELKYAYSSTMAWIYFAIILLVLGLVALIMRKRLSYID